MRFGARQFQFAYIAKYAVIRTPVWLFSYCKYAFWRTPI